MTSFEAHKQEVPMHPHAVGRTEPLVLKPITLPHGVVDPGASGERIGDVKTRPVIQMTPSPSTIELMQSASQTMRFPEETRNNSSSWSGIFLISLRLSFYILVLITTIGLTLAACKFTDIWDPCAVLYINTTECKVTSYFKGMIYHSDCHEEHHCILPGFQSNIEKQGWSLHKPNESAPGTFIFQ